MDDKTHAFWTRYVRVVASQFGLKDWDITVERVDPTQGDLAKNHLRYGQKRAHIRFGGEFRVSDPEEQRLTVVQGLLHCHVEDLSEATRLYINNNDDSDGLFSQIFQREIEILVDNLATAIARSFPTPSHTIYLKDSE